MKVGDKMKEASGEANLTVITIILIGIIVAIATPIINSMMTNTAKRTCCQNYGGVYEGNKCYLVSSTGAKSPLSEGQYWDAKNKKCVGA